MFKWLDKQLFRWLLVVAAAAVSIFMIYKIPDQTAASHAFSIARDFILFVCSTAISWIISSWFAKKESSEKIDTIAERSFEKMAMLTLQIERAKKFLVDTITISQSDSEKINLPSGLSAYKHRINGTIATLDQISTSNDTFRADWLGVVSPEMKQILSDKVEALSNLPSLMSELSRSQIDLTDPATSSSNFGKKIEEVERAVAGAGKLIDEIKPKKAVQKERVAQITQSILEGATHKLQKGTLKIDVQRLTFRASGTGHFEPRMSQAASVTVRLMQHPVGATMESIKYPVGVGIHSDFTIGLMSVAPGVALPFGEYLFEYEATSVEDAVYAIEP